jgi:DNA helicase-2/ATP-dependent DNA helicase PcrA
MRSTGLDASSHVASCPVAELVDVVNVTPTDGSPLQSERVFPWLDDLDPEQRAVASHDGRDLRVLAGAGTGKTTALTGRAAWLVGTGTPADRVLLLTFTRRAARQMVQRTLHLLSRCGERSTKRIVGGTFHAVAHRTLRRNAAALGLPDGFGLLDAADAADVFDLVRQEHAGAAVRDRRFPRKATLVDLYSRSVNTQAPLSKAIDDLAPWCADRVDTIAELCRAYVARKQALGLLDFDDLLLWWRAAVLDERLGPRLASSFDHVLVDEYQDVNALQVDVLHGLHDDASGLTVVGDDAQAIYGFRAASARHLLDAPSVFAGMHTIVLERSYRSTQPICDVANAVSAEAPEGFSARLRPAHASRVSGARPELVRCADEDAEARPCASGCCTIASAASPCGRRPCSCGRPTTRPCWSWSSADARSPSSSTEDCASSKRRT